MAHLTLKGWRNEELAKERLKKSNPSERTRTNTEVRKPTEKIFQEGKYD